MRGPGTSPHWRSSRQTQAPGGTWAMWRHGVTAGIHWHARWVAWGKAEGAHGHCPSATTAPPHGTPPSRACQGSKAVSTFHQQDRNRISLCGTPTPHWLHAGPHNKHRRAVVFPTRKLMWFFWSGSLKYYKSCDSPPIPWWRLLDSSTLRGTNVAPVKASVWGVLQSQGIFHPSPLFFSSL